MIRSASFRDLDAPTLYRLLRLRVDVFVVEQRCAYPELDGRDTEVGALHCWVEQHGAVVSCLRLLVEPDGATRLGRVATAPASRGAGHASALIRHALELAGRPVVCDAQAHLEDFYTRFGFVRDGEEFLEDGIPHVPMRLDA